MTGLEVILPYLAAAGAAVGAVGAVTAAQNQSDAEKYNAGIAEQNAKTAQVEGNQQEEQLRQRARQAIGRQLAATSESGTGLSGTNLDLLNSSIYNMHADVANLRYETALKASGLNAQASLDRSQASSTMASGYLSAAGRLLSASGSYTGGKTVPGYAGIYRGGGMGADASGGLNY